jgi:hypothetical protein
MADGTIFAEVRFGAGDEMRGGLKGFGVAARVWHTPAQRNGAIRRQNDDFYLGAAEIQADSVGMGHARMWHGARQMSKPRARRSSGAPAGRRRGTG